MQTAGRKDILETSWGYLFAMNGALGMMKDWIKNDFPAGTYLTGSIVENVRNFYF